MGNEVDSKGRFELCLQLHWPDVKLAVSLAQRQDTSIPFNKDTMQVIEEPILEYFDKLVALILPKGKYKGRQLHFCKPLNVLIVDIGKVNDIKELKDIKPDRSTLVDFARKISTQSPIKITATIITATVNLKGKDPKNRKYAEEFRYNAFSRILLLQWKLETPESLLSNT